MMRGPPICRHRRRPYAFNYVRPFPEEIGSGATLVQDEKFLAGAEKPEEGRVVVLRTK